MPTMQAQAQRSDVGMREQRSASLRLDHLDRMLTDIGIWQHSEGDKPNPRHGYSIDDEARGLIVGLRYWQQGIQPAFSWRLATICFDFIRAAASVSADQQGRYHNFCDADGNWLDSVGSDDSFGRTIWGLGVAHAVDAPFAPRAAAEAMLRNSLPAINGLQPKYLRAKAFVILGLSASRMDDAHLKILADALADAYEATAGDDWRWFEDHMTYCNARLPQALFMAASIFPEEKRYRQIATESLDFLLKSTHTGKNGYAPVGNAPLTTAGWFQRGQKRPPLFDQQPVDAGALVECCVEAYRETSKPRFRQAAREAFGWYFGQNVHNFPVYNPETGGVADALTRTGLNRNQGAESVLSIHLAHQALQTIE